MDDKKKNQVHKLMTILKLFEENLIKFQVTFKISLSDKIVASQS